MSGPSVEAIQARYGALARGSSSLSCGRAFALSDPRPGERCLDLGCGRGRDVVALAKACGPEGRAVGIDATATMIDQARLAAVAAGLANVELFVATFDHLPLGEGSIDLVLSNCAINHAADKQAVWREVHRVLRPGGRFVVSDIYSLEPVPDRWRNDPAAVAECWAGAVTRPEYLETLASAGFTEVRIVEESEPYVRGAVRLASFTVRGRRPADPDWRV